MSECHPKGPVRVLYSFPHKIGADRICMIAWHQVEGSPLPMHVCSARLGMPTVLERPDAHAWFAYEVVAAECERLRTLLPHYEHAYNAEILRHEE